MGRAFSAIEHYVGGCGAALGLAAAGVEAFAVVDHDADACATARAAGFPTVLEMEDEAAARVLAGMEPDLAILQGFPPSHRFVAKTKRSVYRLIGNAVVPVIAEALGRAVIEADMKIRRGR